MIQKRKRHELDLRKTHIWVGTINDKGRVVKLDTKLILQTMRELGHSNTLFEGCSCNT